MTAEATTLTKAIVEATPSDAEGERAAAVVEKAIEVDPVLLNTLNQEKPWQSGVTVFGSGGILLAVSRLIGQFGTNGWDIGSYDLKLLIEDGGVLAFFIAVLYRRWMPGLKPMFSGWFGAK